MVVSLKCSLEAELLAAATAAAIEDAVAGFELTTLVGRACVVAAYATLDTAPICCREEAALPVVRVAELLIRLTDADALIVGIARLVGATAATVARVSTRVRDRAALVHPTQRRLTDTLIAAACFVGAAAAAVRRVATGVGDRATAVDTTSRGGADALVAAVAVLSCAAAAAVRRVAASICHRAAHGVSAGCRRTDALVVPIADLSCATSSTVCRVSTRVRERAAGVATAYGLADASVVAA